MTTHDKQKRFISHYLPPVLLILAVLAVYAPYLTRTLLYDEAYSYIQYAQSPFIALFAYALPNNHLFHTFLMWLITTLMGGSELAIRYTAMMATLLAVAYLYRIGTRLGSRSMGLLAGVFMVTIPLLVVQIPNGRGYTLSVLLSLIFFEQLYFGPTELSRRQKYTLLATAMLLVMTLPTMLLLIFGLSLWKLLTLLHTRQFSTIIAYAPPVIFGSGIGTLFYSYTLIHDGLNSVEGDLGYQSIPVLLRAIAESLTYTTILPIFIVGILCGVLLIGLHQRRLFGALLCLLTTTSLLGVIQFALTGNVPFPRNYTYLTPFFALVAAAGWAYLLARVPKYNTVMSLGIIALLLGLGGIALRPLAEPTPTDALDDAITAYGGPADNFIIGCCLDYPIYYEHGRYNFTQQDWRIVIVPVRKETFPVLYERHQIPSDFQCNETRWDDFEVHICTPPG